MDSTFVLVYENKARQIFWAAMNREPSPTELHRTVNMLKKGGGFFVGQVLDKEILDDKVDGNRGGDSKEIVIGGEIQECLRCESGSGKDDSCKKEESRESSS